MSMKSSITMAAMMFLAASGGMGGENSHHYRPELPESKPVLPGVFKGNIPKGCKIETITIEIEWHGLRLTHYVDIIYGSLKAREKAIVKSNFAVKEYLRRSGDVSAFHKVESL